MKKALVDAKEIMFLDVFWVNPVKINQNLFIKERKDKKQERTRLIILEAFAEMKEDPERYAKPFKVIIPRKTWEEKQVGELIEISSKIGDHIADWVELALEWAQKLERSDVWWEAICNDPDDTAWFRMVIWKDGLARRIGGCARDNGIYNPIGASNSDIQDSLGGSKYKVKNTVPIIISYE